MKRRSYQLLGANGSVQFEIERGANAALEVREVNRLGEPLNGGFIVHTFSEAQDKVADLIRQALLERRV